VLSLVLLAVATLLKLVPPAATKLVIDHVLMGTPVRLPGGTTLDWSARRLLLTIVIGVFVVSLAGSLLGLWSRWLATRLSKTVQVRMRTEAFEQAARLPLHRVYQLKSGGVASLLRDDAGGVGDLVFSLLFNPFRAIVQLVGGVIVLAFVDWRFLLGAVVLAPAAFGTDRLWYRVLRPLHRDTRKQRERIDARATEAFGGMRVVRAFGRQRTEAVRFVTETNLMTRLEVYGWWLSRIIEGLWELLLPAATGALMLYGGLQVLAGHLSLGDLMMFLVYLAMLLEPIAVLATSVTQLQTNLSGFDRVLDVLDEPREMAEHPGSTSVVREQTQGRMTLEDVSFRYPGSEALVLQDISLDVRPGEMVALVGRSGAGKTTLCNLVARFYDPSQGVVRLDGVDLREYRVESYRQLLGIVEQDVFLFDGTVAQNIAYADRRAPREAIERAAQTANAVEFIRRLPEGYDTLIGERGVRLSGGQRQRLAIARAVLADPRILILDEATSNLDSESERLIQQALQSLLRSRTSFVIAHRLSTVRHADRIVVLDGGRMVEVGTHDDLMAQGGAYREMVELQELGSEVGPS
jgi:ATP-binding cassette subfamily B protein/subfamily B ATP-binding cassette protein MsbA